MSRHWLGLLLVVVWFEARGVAHAAVTSADNPLVVGSVVVGQSRTASTQLSADANTPNLSFVFNNPTTCAEFSIQAPLGTFSINAGNPVTVTVKLAPTTPGSKSCVIDIEQGPGVTIAFFTVQGTAQGLPAIRIDAMPTFTATDVSKSSTAQLKLTNSGNAPLTITTDLALRIAVDPTPALRGPSIPPGFERVVYRCLEKDPARRFPDVGQLAAALAPFGVPATRERAVSAARMLSAAPGAGATNPAVAMPPAPTTLGSSAASLERASGGRRRWGIPLGVLAAGALAAIAVVKLRGGEPEVAPVAPAAHATPVDAAIEPARAPLPSQAPPAAVPGTQAADAAPPIDAAVAVDASPATDARSSGPAAVPPDAARPMRKVTPPRSAPRGSDDDLSNSRL
jgi:hypothetical protein